MTESRNEGIMDKLKTRYTPYFGVCVCVGGGGGGGGGQGHAGHFVCNNIGYM